MSNYSARSPQHMDRVASFRWKERTNGEREEEDSIHARQVQACRLRRDVEQSRTERHGNVLRKERINPFKSLLLTEFTSFDGS